MSSDAPPTELNSVETAEAKPETKEEEGFTVDKRSKQTYMLVIDSEVLRAAFKCSSCQMVTVHIGQQITMYDATKPVVLDEKARIQKRVYGCSNCGKITTK